MGKRFDTLLKVFNSRTYDLNSLEHSVAKLELVCSGKLSTTAGLCSSCLLELPPVYRNVLFKTWKKFSGDIQYPIFDKHCTLFKSAESQYCNLDKYFGTYGDLRIKLAKHCIKKITKDIKKLKKLGYK